MSKKNGKSVAPAKTQVTARANEKISKSEGEMPEQGDSEEEEDEAEEGDMEKSLSDLQKGLEILEAVGARAGRSRKDELLAKAREGLDEAEFKELEGELTGKRLQKAIESSDEIQKGLDQSPAINDLAKKVAEAVDALSSRIEKGEENRGDFEQAVAQSLVAMGGVLEALVTVNQEVAKSLDGPARAPKAQDRVQKALPRDGDQPPVISGQAQAPAISRKQLVSTLEVMHRDSLEKGMGGQSSSYKEELSNLLAGCDPNPRVLQDVVGFIKSRG